MLHLDIKGIMHDREIAHPYAYLCKNGFSPYIVSRMLNNKTKSISFRQLEKLCLLLHCTPNDLYVWQAVGKASRNPNQPVQQLVPSYQKPLLQTTFNHLPIHKIREIRQTIEAVMKNA